ncbi:MAG TPA: hypothetical protein VMV49_05120 [Candidatus Deferrimicrobium sp.]|nr:hypothetical protein [Candidatus Deferrimicrobium sp.]
MTNIKDKLKSTHDKVIPKLFIEDPVTQEKLVFFDFPFATLKHRIWVKNMEGTKLLYIRAKKLIQTRSQTGFFWVSQDLNAEEDYDVNSPRFLGELSLKSIFSIHRFQFTSADGILLFSIKRDVWKKEFRFENHKLPGSPILAEASKLWMKFFMEVNLHINPSCDRMTRLLIICCLVTLLHRD